MAKLHYFYSSMNAGKTTHLLQANYNYKNNGYRTILIKPDIDDRFSLDEISSRIGIKAKSNTINIRTNIKDLVLKEHTKENPIQCLFIDEVQFLTKKQIDELVYIADILNITVMAYGIRTNFKGELFEATKRLFEVADCLEEIKKLCHCGKKATMILRHDKKGNILKEGDEIKIGAEDCYTSVCRKHYFEGNIGDFFRK